MPAHPCDEERTKVGRKLLGRDDGILVGEHVLAIEAAPMAANDAGGLLLLEVERAHGRETIEYHRALELGRRDGEHQGREHQYYSGQHRAHTHTREWGSARVSVGGERGEERRRSTKEQREPQPLLSLSCALARSPLSCVASLCFRSVTREEGGCLRKAVPGSRATLGLGPRT